MKLKVGDLVTVKHLWHRGGLQPVTVFKVFSGHQAIVVDQNGKRYKVTTGQCSEPLTETEFFKQILLHNY